MDQSEALERIEEAQKAAQALGFLTDPIEKMKENVIKLMLSRYRSGNTQHDMLLGAVAELSALDMVLQDLKTTIRRGELAAEQEMRNG